MQQAGHKVTGRQRTHSDPEENHKQHFMADMKSMWMLVHLYGWAWMDPVVNMCHMLLQMGCRALQQYELELGMLVTFRPMKPLSYWRRMSCFS